MTTLYTIGHSNRTIEDFISLLVGAGMTCLVDVRAYPASRRHPQFARAALDRSLAAAGIRYVWEGGALGGRRRQTAESPHVALSEPAFRAYADHMATAGFRDGIGRLKRLGDDMRTAVMCAERLPCECHRSFIADFLVAGGDEVWHVLGPGEVEAHVLNASARLRDGRLVYDGATQRELEL